MTEQLKVAPKLNIIYFNSDHSHTPECRGKLAASTELSWTLVSTWSEMTEALQVDNAILAVHVDMMTQGPVKSVIEFMSALETISKFKICNGQLKIGVVISTSTPRSIVKDLRKTQCQGILLHVNEHPISEVNKAMKYLGSGIAYWPKHIIDELPGNVKILPNTDKVTLTPRQEQVFRLIVERGSSNKAIAKSIGISESTVKLHLTEIFKKYGVRNRTQLVVFSHVF
jgi:DNA-binding NarL/FixJ family response regulator